MKNRMNNHALTNLGSGEDDDGSGDDDDDEDDEDDDDLENAGMDFICNSCSFRSDYMTNM